MPNPRLLELAKRQMNPSLPKERKPDNSNSGLTQILERDENGKPKLNLISIEKTAVNTTTQEDYWDLMQVYECGGWKWYDGVLPTQLNIWKEYKEKTCVDAGIYFFGNGKFNAGRFGYSPIKRYQDNNWNIISPQKFYNAQKPKITSDMLKEINNWFDKNGK